MGIESPRSHGDPSVNVQLQGTGAPVNQALQEAETGRSLRRGCQPVTAFRVYPEVQMIGALYRLEHSFSHGTQEHRNTGLCLLFQTPCPVPGAGQGTGSHPSYFFTELSQGSCKVNQECQGKRGCSEDQHCSLQMEPKQSTHADPRPPPHALTSSPLCPPCR